MGVQRYVLCQSKSDESLWFLRSTGDEGLGAIAGLLVVYVDDLAFFSEELICQAFVGTVQAKWKTSPPTWFGKEPVTFLRSRDRIDGARLLPHSNGVSTRASTAVPCGFQGVGTDGEARDCG